MTQVLVLNQDYQAISVCNSEKAVVLILLKKAELVADIAEKRIRSVNLEIQFPSVIRLNSFVRLPYRQVALTRENVFRRDGYQCVYCGSRKQLTLDHVIPRARGGHTTWKNLVTACVRCNAGKGDLSLEKSGLALPFTPFRPSFIMYLSRFSGKVNEDWKPFLYMA
ncbi:MAG: HNH endonuclease [Bacteroidia bacterium]